MFLKLDRVCFVDPEKGTFGLTPRGPSYYHEIVGSTQSKPLESCISFIFFRNCTNVQLYNFRIVCRGGTLGAPELYVAGKMHDPAAQEKDFRVISNQLSLPAQTYLKNPIGPSPEPKRYYYPVGYAPLGDGSLGKQLVSIPWDEKRGRPLLHWTPNAAQEAIISSLFARIGERLEPFPVSRLDQVAALRKAPGVPTSAPGPGHLAILVAVFVLGAIANWWITRNMAKTALLQRAAVLAAIGILSGLVLYALNVPDGITLVVVGILGGVVGISISLFS